MGLRDGSTLFQPEIPSKLSAKRALYIKLENKMSIDLQMLVFQTQG